jgi:hypothetical protein
MALCVSVMADVAAEVVFGSVAPVPSKIATVSSRVRFFVSITSEGPRVRDREGSGKERQRTEVEEDTLEHEPDAVHNVVLPANSI